MVQLPYSSSDAVLPETVHTAGVVEEKVTDRPELAVADRATLVDAICPSGMDGKVMVCDWGVELRPVPIRLMV